MLKNRGSSLFLGWVIASMIYLAVLTLAGVLLSHSFSEKWISVVDNVITVQVTDSEKKSINDNSINRLDAVLKMLRMTPGIKKITVLKDQETTRLLESWMPAEAFKNIDIPALIEIEFMEISDVSRLATRINNIAPGSLLDDHNDWKIKLSLVIKILESVGWIIFSLVIIVSLVSVIFAVATNLAANKEVISIVHLIGGGSDFISKICQNHILSAIAPAAIIGASMAIGTVFFVQSYTITLLAQMFSGKIFMLLDFFGLREWCLIVGTPFLFIILSLVTVRVSTLMLLKKPNS
jgi:cell division transport system permease protein